MNIENAIAVVKATCNGNTSIVMNRSGFSIVGPPSSVSSHIRRINESEATLAPVAVSPVDERFARATYNSAVWDEQKHPRKGGRFRTKAESEKEQNASAHAAKAKAASYESKAAAAKSGRAKFESLRKNSTVAKSTVSELGNTVRVLDAGHEYVVEHKDAAENDVQVPHTIFKGNSPTEHQDAHKRAMERHDQIVKKEYEAAHRNDDYLKYVKHGIQFKIKEH